MKVLSLRHILQRSIFILTVGAAFHTAIFAATVWADEAALIKIRTISAHKIQPRESGASQELKSLAYLPPALSDISDKLQELPFNSFKLQAHDELLVRLKDLTEVQLESEDPQMSAHSLKLKLLGLSRGKVCLWMNWREVEGEEILDSRVHFKQGEQFITGTETKDGVGMLVVLQVIKQD